MIRHRTPRLLVVMICCCFGIPALAQGNAPITVSKVITELDEPWAMAHLPDGGVLITEIDGRLLLWRNGNMQTVSGGPIVKETGQGGLLDITLPRDFATSREVFLSYTKAQGQGEGTALASARLSQDGTRLEGPVCHDPGILWRSSFWQPHR